MVGRSVLPEILRLGDASGVRVAFIRVQRRPSCQAPAQSDGLVRYMRDLRQYLAEHGAYSTMSGAIPNSPCRSMPMAIT